MVQGREGVRPVVARARARSELPVIQRRLEQACADAQSFTASLLELRDGQGADGQVPPSHEVESDRRHVELCG